MGGATPYARAMLLTLEWLFSMALFSVCASLFPIRWGVLRFLFTWAFIGWVVYTVMLVMTLTNMFSSGDVFSARGELVIQATMVVVIWFTGAVVASVRVPDLGRGTTVIALYWVAFVLGIISSILSSIDSKSGSSEAEADKPPPAPTTTDTVAEEVV